MNAIFADRIDQLSHSKNLKEFRVRSDEASSSSCSSSGDTNSWRRTFQQENKEEALQRVLEMSKVRSIKGVHCFCVMLSLV